MAAQASGEPVDRLHELYRELSALDHPACGFRRWNAVADQIFRVLPLVLSDPVQFARLREIAATDPDPFVRKYAGGDADPLPDATSPAQMVEWLRHPAVDLTVVVDDVRVGLRLEPVLATDEESRTHLLAQWQDHGEHCNASWLGGEPLGPLDTWPRRDDDIPLAHVVQVDLRWVADPSVIVPGPDEPLGPTLVNQPVEPVVYTALPCWEDVPRALQERLIDAREVVLRSIGGWSEPSAVAPPSLLLGNGWESAQEARRLLDAAAGPGEGAWVLLFDIAGVGPLDQWFGDEGHLEVWIRETDLAEHRFDRAWALLR